MGHDVLRIKVVGIHWPTEHHVVVEIQEELGQQWDAMEVRLDRRAAEGRQMRLVGKDLRRRARCVCVFDRSVYREYIRGPLAALILVATQYAPLRV